MLHEYTELRLDIRMRLSAAVDLVDIEPADERLTTDVLPVLVELRPQLTPDSFRATYGEGYPQGLRFLAAYAGGRCVGVAGWRLVATTHVGRKLYVDDLVTTESARSTGVGRALLDELAIRAVAAGCSALDLDSGVQRGDAHRFYFRERMHITSYHFARRLD
jgi:GNAT superfamily N-acetyltransferase